MKEPESSSVGAVKEEQEQEIQSASQKSGKYLTFFLDEEEYGLEILKVKEIMGLMKITKVPRTPNHIRGVINLRGKVIPVMDLRTRFDMEATEDTEETCIIVVDIALKDRSVLMGILVDRVSEVLDIAAGEIEDAPSFGATVNTEYILGMGKIKEKVVILLDIDSVLGSEDLAILESTSNE